MSWMLSFAMEILLKTLKEIVAPPGSGKTIVALKIISKKQQPTLIIVHRKQFVEQWIERIETFPGIAKIEIGKIGEGKNKVGKKITVATIQSLSKGLNTCKAFQTAFDFPPFISFL